MAGSGNNTNVTYSQMGYNSFMERQEGVFGVAQIENNNALTAYNSINDNMFTNGTPDIEDPSDMSNGSVQSQALGNLTISGTIQSFNYSPQQQGFLINGGSGYAEFNGGTFVDGTFTAGIIDGTTINASTINGGTINGSTITGVVFIGNDFETATSGQRIRILSDIGASPLQSPNSIALIDASGQIVFAAGSASEFNNYETVDIIGNPVGLNIEHASGTDSPLSLVSIESTNSYVGATALGVSANATKALHFVAVMDIANASGSDVTFWVSDGTSPSGVLGGYQGDVCFGADGGKPYYCTGSTSWTAF